MDHARTLGVTPGLENPGQVLDRVIEAGADGIMTSYGVIKHCRERLIGRIPTFLRLDGGPSKYREDWLRYSEWSLLHTVEDARRLGVDGVCVMGFMGGPVEMRTYEIVARVVGDCRQDGLPVMVEALPCQQVERIPDPLAAEPMASAARIAFELGADIVKTYYTGSPESFRQVVRNCPAPVLIAGGTRMDTIEAALDDPAAIGGIAVASMGESAVPLDADDRPLGPAVAWFDRRTLPEADWLERTIGLERLFATSGLHLDPTFGLCKLLWLKRARAEAYRDRKSVV